MRHLWLSLSPRWRVMLWQEWRPASYRWGKLSPGLTALPTPPTTNWESSHQRERSGPTQVQRRLRQRKGKKAKHLYWFSECFARPELIVLISPNPIILRKLISILVNSYYKYCYFGYHHLKVLSCLLINLCWFHVHAISHNKYKTKKIKINKQRWQNKY